MPQQTKQPKAKQEIIEQIKPILEEHLRINKDRTNLSRIAVMLD